jgi:hypothetical protein
MVQKPHAKSKTYDHNSCLQHILGLWEKGKSLRKEGLSRGHLDALSHNSYSRQRFINLQVLQDYDGGEGERCDETFV